MAQRIDRDHSRPIAVHNVVMLLAQSSGRLIRGLSFSCRLGASRSFFSCQIFLGEALFPRFCLPIVVPHPPTVQDDSAAELTKHGLGGDDGNLPRSVRIRKDLLVDEVIFL